MVEVKQQFTYLTGKGRDLVFTGKDREYFVNPAKVTNPKGRPISLSNLHLYQPAVLTSPNTKDGHVINAMIHREEQATAFFQPALPTQVIKEQGFCQGFQAARVVNSSPRGIFEVVLVGYVEWMIKNRRFQSGESAEQVESIEKAIAASNALNWSPQEFEYSGQTYSPIWSGLRKFLSALHASQGSNFLSHESDYIRAASLFGVSLKVHNSHGSASVCEQPTSRPELDVWVGDQYLMLLYKEDQVRQLPFDLWTRQPTEWETLQTMLLEMVLEVGNWIRVKSAVLFRSIFGQDGSADIYTRLSRSIQHRRSLLEKLCVAIRLCSECCTKATAVVLVCGRSLCGQCHYRLLTAASPALSSSSVAHSCGQAACSLTPTACQICGEANLLIETVCACRICFLCAVHNEPYLSCIQHRSMQFPPNVISRLKRQWNLKVPFRTCARCHLNIYGSQLTGQLKCMHKVHITHINHRTKIFCIFCQTFVSFSLSNP